MKLEEVKKTIQYFKKTYIFAKDQKKELIKFLIFSGIITLISVITPVLSAQMLLKITDGKFKELITIALLFFFISIFDKIMIYFMNKNYQLYFRKTLLEIQLNLASETSKLKVKEIDNNTSGLFITRLNSDSSQISFSLGSINEMLIIILSKIGVLIALFFLNKFIFLYFVITLIILYFIDTKRMKLYFERDKEYRKLREKNTGMVGEMVRGIRDLKVLNSSDTFLEKVKEQITRSNDKNYEMSMIARKYGLLSGSIKDFLDLIFIILGVSLISNKLLTVASFLIAYNFRDKLFSLFNNVSRLFERMKDFNLSSERVFAVIEEGFEKETFGKKKVKKLKGNFEFKEVSFSYQDGIKVLDNVNFKIKENETIAFVGESGGGKSTIFSLIDKLYEPTKGNIYFDGINIEELTKDSIRDNISIITQNPYIFHMTIKENLKIVRENVTDEEIKEVCKLACLDKFIESLPNKYDTLVGEGGLNLSGGQRQRLAIARALLKKTEIILMDEATSALDNETQNEIKKAINNMKGEYTILIIAHRLSTINNCDRIIVIDKGKIKGEGTHKYLMKNNKTYKKLYESEIEK